MDKHCVQIIRGEYTHFPGKSFCERLPRKVGVSPCTQTEGYMDFTFLFFKYYFYREDYSH